MNESEKSLIWDLLIPDRELKEWAGRLLHKPLGAMDKETLWQDMRLFCWEKLTNRNYWIASAKNFGRNQIQHELCETKYGHKLSSTPELGFDEAIMKLTTRNRYGKS
jgi:hypothetical protein